MDVFTIARVCWKRWFIFVPLLVLALGGAYRAADSHKAVFTAQNSLVVLGASVYSPSNAPGSGAGGAVGVNPYGTAYMTAANTLVQALNNPSAAEAIHRQSGAASYEVAVDQQSPILAVSAHAATFATAA